MIELNLRLLVEDLVVEALAEEDTSDVAEVLEEETSDTEGALEEEDISDVQETLEEEISTEGTSDAETLLSKK